jgi:hypothetical protein
MVFWFIIYVLYGVVWSVILTVSESERRRSLLHVLYLFGFVGLSVPFSSAAFGGVVGSDGIVARSAMGAMGGVVVGLGICLVGLAFHGVPVYYCLMHFVRGVGRAAAGLDHIVLSKSYNRAEGAESRGDLAEAERLYRQELEADPEDAEARRRLAELLVRQGRAQEAVPEFETVIEQVEGREKRYATTFRLAEVLEEELGRRQEAAELYRRIVQEDPRSRYAQYARSRLGHGDPSDAPTDH